MFGNPEVSVVMGVYNGAEYLREAMDSILAQTFLNFEFIIIDDCSNDDSAQILKEYAGKDERVIVLKNEKNLGLTKSLNLGIAQARGQYIARMDADDISLPDRLAKQLLKIKSDLKIKIVGCNVVLMDESGIDMKTVYLPTIDQLNKKIKHRNCLVHGSLLFEKRALESVGFYDERFEMSQDYDLILRLLKTFALGIVYEPLYKLRRGQNNLSTKKFLKQIYFTALAKSNYAGGGFVFSWFYSFVIIYKFGLPSILRKFGFIK